MDALWETLPVLCLFISVRAQETSNEHGVDPLHPSTAAVLIALSIMFCVMFLIVAYGKCCYRPEQFHQSEIQGPRWIVRSSSRFSGIDRAVVESLPFFRFSSLKGSKEGLECAVCLSVFEDSEILRLLPRCRHAFHMNCIDKWLESHSSCPLCRYRFDAGELGSLACTNSFRNLRASTDEPNLEFYLPREQSQGSSSRFNMVNTFQKLAWGRKEEPLIREFNNKNNDGKLLHSVRHKVIVSDVMHKSRWSDVNSSDLMSLNSQMLDFLSSKRFSSVDQSVSGSFTSDLSGKEQILKIKKDIERKRLYEYKVCTDEQTPSASRCNESDAEIEHVSTSKALDPAQKRSMSEITNVSRFTDRFVATTRVNGLSTASNKDDSVRRLWMPIARRTVQWFAGREKSSDARKCEGDV